jgi:UDP-glucose 4-epimerase
MKRCLVLGANGFIGRHLVPALLEAGYAVRVYERRLTVGLPKAAETRQGLLEDENLLTEALQEVETVIYLSWTGYPATIKTNFALDLHANLLTAIKVMEACRRQAVARLIFASSGGTVYGVPQHLPITETHPTHPISAHGLGKLMAEQYLAVYRARGELASIVLRPANPYGPYQWPERQQGFIATALGRIAQQRPIEVWGQGETVRDYVHVRDVAEAFVKAVAYQGNETVFNIGSGVGLSLNAVLAEIEKITQRKPQVVFQSAYSGDVAQNVLDITRARQALQWTPQIYLSAGLLDTWRWIQQALHPDVLTKWCI